ncbi:hypothetical protein B0H15DRAFT_822530 [Mycena belliarum]|uniref:Secreted protein n=1 Tax=Mycena belliarum TaxID=1033014 RepID=A0AAD6XR75_9AGAR|nr:hypothetical protein B0H15DRAFT_822530 [Mycena belliae]
MPSFLLCLSLATITLCIDIRTRRRLLFCRVARRASDLKYFSARNFGQPPVIQLLFVSRPQSNLGKLPADIEYSRPKRQQLHLLPLHWRIISCPSKAFAGIPPSP